MTSNKQEKNMRMTADIAEALETLINAQECKKGQISRQDLLDSLQSDDFKNKLLSIIVNDQRTLKDPNAPKKPLSAYFLFCQAERAKAKEKDPEATLKTVELAAKWNSIKDTKKADKYKKQAEEQKAEYKTAMESYEAPSVEDLLALPENKPKTLRKTKTKGTPKKKKPAGYPKGAKNAWMCYASANRDAVKAEESDAKEVTKKLGAMWKALGEEEKKPYEKLAKKDKKRYDEEMAKWNAEHAEEETEETEEKSESAPEEAPASPTPKKAKKAEATPVKAKSKVVVVEEDEASSDDSEDEAKEKPRVPPKRVLPGFLGAKAKDE